MKTSTQVSRKELHQNYLRIKGDDEFGELITVLTHAILEDNPLEMDDDKSSAKYAKLLSEYSKV